MALDAQMLKELVAKVRLCMARHMHMHLHMHMRMDMHMHMHMHMHMRILALQGMLGFHA
jgi:hypothetical protein